MEFVDKVTLELLMNKNTYSRYIERTDPNKHTIEKEFREKIKKYKTRILRLIIKYLDDPNFELNNELDNSFSEYMRLFIKYFEMNDLDNSTFHESDSEDTMFDPTKIDETNIFEYKSEPEYENLELASVTADDGKSSIPFFCSDKINRSLSRYTMDKYVTRANNK